MRATRRQALAGIGAGALASGSAMAATGSGGAKMDDFAEYDALGLARLVRERRASPTELLDTAIARSERLNPRFNFIAQEHYDFARKAIAAGLPQGPFTGVPWLLKDLHTFLKGELTEGGSRFYKGYRAEVTSELATRYMQAGFVIFGKTTTPEFGLTGTTESTLRGATRNPWDPEHIAGGSSGGAAAAVASGVIPAAHASDGGGSIRIPASCCGLFGMKPSRGRVPMGPLRTEGWGGLSTHHAVTRSVRDSAAILDATHGVEPGARYGAPCPEGTFLENVKRDPGSLRVALMLAPFAGSPVDPQCLAAARDAARLCESLGHKVEEAAPDVDAAEMGFASFAIIGPSIAADVEDRAKLLGIEAGPDVLEPVTLGMVEYGKTFTARDMARATNTLQEIAIRMGRFMQDYDLIVTPTLAEPPVEIGEIGLTPRISLQEWGERLAAFSPFTQIANMTGQPAMSLPLSMSDEGLPIGVQFIGRYGEEDLMFRLAGQIERAAPWGKRRPSV